MFNTAYILQDFRPYCRVHASSSKCPSTSLILSSWGQLLKLPLHLANLVEFRPAPQAAPPPHQSFRVWAAAQAAPQPRQSCRVRVSCSSCPSTSPILSSWGSCPSTSSILSSWGQLLKLPLHLVNLVGLGPAAHAASPPHQSAQINLWMTHMKGSGWV